MVKNQCKFFKYAGPEHEGFVQICSIAYQIDPENEPGRLLVDLGFGWLGDYVSNSRYIPTTRTILHFLVVKKKTIVQATVLTVVIK